MALVLAAVCARADTITLKDGTMVEGDITTEDESSVSIHLEFAHGTITETRKINKSDIAQVARATPEQKAALQLKRDYETLGKYQLNPEESYRLEYYDDVINNAFRRFLSQHPNSVYETNVTALITQWEAERNLVAAGSMRFHGRWMPAAEGMRLALRERGERSLQRSRWFISQGRFDSAIQELQSVLAVSGQPELVSKAKSMLAVAYQKSIEELDRQRQELETDVSSSQQRVGQDQQALNSAEASLRQAASNRQSFAGPSPVGSLNPTLGSNAQAINQSQASVNSARSSLVNEQRHLDQAKYELNAATQKLATLRSQESAAQARWGISTAPSPASASPVAAVNTNTPDVLVGTAAWVRNNWVIMAVVALVLLFILSRIIKG
ncbi:MAG TPA: hypothetical protein VMP11_08780 [Verrucomicrobiae bacterium]|nr:hypothetical protein [Verrucomicrobiae bacterium]